MITVSGKFHENLLKSKGAEATGFALFDKSRAVIWPKWTSHDLNKILVDDNYILIQGCHGQGKLREFFGWSGNLASQGKVREFENKWLL